MEYEIIYFLEELFTLRYIFRIYKTRIRNAINKATACHEKTNWVGISLFPGINYLLHNIIQMTSSIIIFHIKRN